MRGTPCALTRHLGNLHACARPLRAALYLRLLRQGLLRDTAAVRECFPEWHAGGEGGGAVVWQEHVVDLPLLRAAPPQDVLVRDEMDHSEATLKMQHAACCTLHAARYVLHSVSGRVWQPVMRAAYEGRMQPLQVTTSALIGGPLL